MPEGPNAQAAQIADVTAGPEHDGKVTGHGTDIGSLATANINYRMVRVWNLDQIGLIDRDPARSELELNPLPRQIIGPLAIDLDGRKVGGNLIMPTTGGAASRRIRGESCYGALFNKALAGGTGIDAVARLRRELGWPELTIPAI